MNFLTFNKKIENNKIIIENINNNNFILEHIFECGQCFRFNKINQENKTYYQGVAYRKYLKIYEDYENYENKKNIIFESYDENINRDFENVWKNFFDLDRDYNKIYRELSEKDEVLKRAANYSKGIRILKQEPFECLISYIISANNNIPRIKKIVESLCVKFGEKIANINGEDFYAFPKVEELADLNLEDLDVIKSGFRAKYILEAAKRINSGEINLNKVWDLNFEDAKNYLKNIKGVGDKIASCILLFAYNKLESFPVDVWIKKVLEKYYNELKSLEDYNNYFGKYAGIAQEYLYYYERNLN